MTAVMRKLHPPLLLLLVGLLLLISACAIGGDADVPPTPVRELVVLDLSMINGRPAIDPQKISSQDSYDLAENLFIGLTNYNQESNTIEPEFAQSWTISEDGLVWTFDLREDVYWVQADLQVGREGKTAVSPIRPVTADDAVFAIQRACLRSTGTPNAFIFFIIQGCRYLYDNPPVIKEIAEEDLVEGIIPDDGSLSGPSQLALIGAHALDAHTLEIRLNSPRSSFLSMTSMTALAPVPRDLVNEFGDDSGVEGRIPTWNSVEEAVYSGPFIIAPATTEERTVLHRNPEWKLPPRNGNVDIVNLWHLDNADAAFEQWQNKLLDLSPLPALQRKTMLEDKPERVLLIPEQTLFYLGFNTESPALSDPDIRQALSAALDRELFVQDLYNGRAIQMRHLMPPGLVGSLLADQTGAGYNPDLARQRMADSQYRACRLMPPLTILASNADLSLRVAELARDMWVEELGCAREQITIEQASFGELLAITANDAEGVRPDVWELGWTAHYPDADNWMGDLMHCADGQNREKRPCDATDSLIAQAALTMDGEQRTSLYRQMENQFFGETGTTPIAPLYLPGDYLLVQSWMTGYTPALFGGEQYDRYILDPLLKRLERSRVASGK